VIGETGGCEALFWVNGQPAGIFNHADYKWQRGDHRGLLLASQAKTGDVFEIALEAYAGHHHIGVHPHDTAETQDAYRPPFRRQFEGVRIARRDELVKDFVVDLHVIRTLCEGLSERSFRRGQLLAVLDAVYAMVWEEPSTVEESDWRRRLEAAHQLLLPVLKMKNGDAAPRAGLIGHSHLDTAWLWSIDESIRKCARTYSNVLSLMDQYPEYQFIQSSALHADFMRVHYPSVFEGIKQRVKDGRWEPNGGVWLEPDVNLSGGEALIRQFILGQRFTQTHFNYTSDTFWLPDTFGYSAALPQIMRGCGIQYFLTTKLSWNDTNSFPFDTFQWEGIDGSTVFTHFNDIHCAPDPGTLINKLEGSGPKDFRKTENCVRHPDVNQARLVSFGRGDGGGGPDFEMLEVARRVEDLDGCPKGKYVSVSSFMQELEADSVRAPRYVGELYFEGHRGVYTQQAAIKRLNRASEVALRNLEYCAVRAYLCAHSEQYTDRIEDLWRVLLLNQFHDILPGTSIPEVHDRAIRELEALVCQAEALTQSILDTLSVPVENELSLHNSLSWQRERGWIPGSLPIPCCVSSQQIETPWGEARTVLAGLSIPALGASVLDCSTVDTVDSQSSPFQWEKGVLQAPHARLEFNDNGGIVSWIDSASGRELCTGREKPMNRFVFGEDMPAEWDNWDIDEDLELKLESTESAVEVMVVADGPLQFRLRHRIPLTKRSWILQDVVVHADSAQVDFETLVQWEEPHRYLGVEFPLAVHAPSARHEIQFGHIQRGTHRNFSEDRARFEVSQHKWSDLSEANFGVSLLNDSKYGLSVLGSRIRLSLMKGGGHPDPRGNPGAHRFTYALLPHTGGFSVESIVRPAYELNVPLMAHVGSSTATEALIESIEDSIVVESIKPAESGRGFVLRSYDAAGGASRMKFQLSEPLHAIADCDLLEREIPTKEWHTPFAIRSVWVDREERS
jgi:alpha-mannosidase